MIRLFRDFELKVACVGFAVTTSMVTLNVILRYLFSKSLLFSEEIAYLGFAYSVFLGAAYLYRMRVMIAVEFLFDLFNRRQKAFVVMASLILLQITNIYMTYISILLASDGWIRRSAYLEMPYAYIHSAPVFGFGLMSAYTAVMLYQAISGRTLHFAEAADQK